MGFVVCAACHQSAVESMLQAGYARWPQQAGATTPATCKQYPTTSQCFDFGQRPRTEGTNPSCSKKQKTCNDTRDSELSKDAAKPAEYVPGHLHLSETRQIKNGFVSFSFLVLFITCDAAAHL